MVHPPSSIVTKPWIDVHEYWCRRWTSLSAKRSGKSIYIGRIEFFLWQPSTALWKYDKRQCRSTPCNSAAGSYLSRCLMKILLNVWILNWPLFPYHSSIRYPCARLTRPSCIRGSNHSADVCRAAAILRAACLSCMDDIYYISKCVDMASACDIPRLVKGVLCTTTLLRWLLHDLRWIQRWP